MLNKWFSNNNTKLTNFYQNLDDNSIGLHVKSVDDLDEVKKNDVLLFADDSNIHQMVMTQLYPLDYPFKSIRIFDLGTLQELSNDELHQAIAKIFESGAKIINIHSNPKVAEAIFNYLNSLDAPYEAMNISSKTKDIESLALTQCKRFVEFGVQGHLSNLKIRHNDVIRVRLGSLKNDLVENEPFCRHQHYVTLDCNAIKHSDFPGHHACGPAGLNAEELTKIFRYLGFNNKLKAISITGYYVDQDFNHQGAKLLAQLIWYYTKALNDCITENIHHEAFTEYVVDLTESEEPLVFLQGEKSLRWWIKDESSGSLTPCSHNDYKIACNNEIPNRIFL